MANRVLVSDGTPASGAWYGIEAIGTLLLGTFSNQDALSTERTIPVTFANAGNQVGIILCIRNNTVATGDITVKLEENVGGTWTLRTTDTFALSGYDTYFLNFLYLPLTFYAVTTGVSTWRYKVSHPSSSVYLIRSSTASDWFYAVALDYSTANPSSGDWIAVADTYTLTMSADWTFGGAINYTGSLLCRGATLFISEGAGATTYTFSAPIIVGTDGTLQVGTSAAVPISTAKQVTLDVSNAITQTGSTYKALLHHPQRDYYGNKNGKFSLLLYGEECDYIRGIIASPANNGQKDVVLVENYSAFWQAGDKVVLLGNNVADNTEYTIASVAGATVTLTANLNQAYLAGGAVINQTATLRKVGIKLINSSTTGSGTVQYQAWYPKTFKLQGVYIRGMTLTAWGFQGYYTTGSYYTETHFLRSILFDSSALTAVANFLNVGVTTEQSVRSFAITNVHRYDYNFRFAAGPYIHNATNLTVTKFSNGKMDNIGLYIGGAGVNITLSDIIATSTAQIGAVARASCVVMGAKVDISDSFFHAYSTTWGGLYIKANAATIRDSSIQGPSYYNLFLDSCVDLTLTDVAIGTVSRATSADIAVYANGYIQALFDNCDLPTTLVLSGVGDTVDGSYLKFHKYDMGASDHRVFLTYGNLISTGDGLLDTTVHTAGTGKFALRFEPTSSANNLTWTFDVPTGDIAAKTMTVACWVKINAAAYYAGTHQKPRLTVRYDNATDAYAEATATTDWQLLAVNISPTTTYGQITVTVSGRTDATGSDAYFYADDFAVIYPAGYSLNLGGLNNWADALPVVPPIDTVLSAEQVWTVQTATLEGATGSMGKLVVDNLNAPVAGRAAPGDAMTLAAAYDRAKDALALSEYTAPPSAATIADAVLDEPVTGHTGWLTKLLSVAKFLGLK